MTITQSAIVQYAWDSTRDRGPDTDAIGRKFQALLEERGLKDVTCAWSRVREPQPLRFEIDLRIEWPNQPGRPITNILRNAGVEAAIQYVFGGMRIERSETRGQAEASPRISFP